ncbi:hypothetical protein [Frigoriglobus tundricola]|uniref:Uncharacterized protein n=1 Tax=Frigoriglobus tundricola TaxID=2774151 RepID=A0A6M5YSB6_9BACT|nr:hypothetical protein [Frigoriglobus tundricola]QJW96183.1 hypothetical protein FTUN_3739 [Frigoriglobus tundricola]
MVNALTRVGMLLLAAALTASAGSGQPPGGKAQDNLIKAARDYSTAFPDLEPPITRRDVITNPDGTTVVVTTEIGVVPLPAVPAPAANAPALRKVRVEQYQEGSDCLERLKVIIRTGNYRPQDFCEYVRVATEVYRAAAEMEDEPARRVPWYEARVRKFKEVERFIRLRVEIGTDPPDRLDVVRFHRFGAEAELLELKAGLENPGRKPARLPADPKGEPVRLEKGAAYTAFPDLKPPATEKGDVPTPQLPTLTAADPPLRKVQIEQVRKGLAFLAHVKEQGPIEDLTPELFREYLDVATETYRLAAELEDTPAQRVPWHETRIRKLKQFEQLILRRVENGVDPRQRLNTARFDRLQAEADLLGLQADLSAAKDARPVEIPKPVRPNAGGEPAPRPLPRGPGAPNRYTAFPDLKPATLEKTEIKSSDGSTTPGLEETGGVPVPAVPVPTADAPPLRRVRFVQAQTGSDYLERVKYRMKTGIYNLAILRELQIIAADTYRLAAELEGAPAKRVPWYEARVRKLKAFEEFVRSRVEDKDEAPQRLDVAGFQRLRAEADLLKLKTEIEKAGGK